MNIIKQYPRTIKDGKSVILFENVNINDFRKFLNNEIESIKYGVNMPIEIINNRELFSDVFKEKFDKIKEMCIDYAEINRIISFGKYNIVFVDENEKINIPDRPTRDTFVVLEEEFDNTHYFDMDLMQYKDRFLSIKDIKNNCKSNDNAINKNVENKIKEFSRD